MKCSAYILYVKLYQKINSLIIRPVYAHNMLYK